MAKPIKVFFQGSFDLLHYGHFFALKKAKEQGDYLIVALNTDTLYKNYKFKVPAIKYRYRKKMLESIRYVDEVIPISIPRPLPFLKKLDIDVYITCKEWVFNKQEEIDYMKKAGKRVVILPYFNKSVLSSSVLKNYIDHSKDYCAKCHRRL